MNNEGIDAEDELAGTKSTLERTHSFRGKPLAKYSFAHRGALFRFGEGHTLSGFEECIYLVFMLLTKKPHEVDALRSSKALAKFRMDAGEWAESVKVHDEPGWTEVNNLAKAILIPVAEAGAPEPVETAEHGKTHRSPNE